MLFCSILPFLAALPIPVFNSQNASLCLAKLLVGEPPCDGLILDDWFTDVSRPLVLTSFVSYINGGGSTR